ncbi:ATP-binding cassette domain-containing protein [Leptolyngbya sp. 7M]|uniref:ATP-binding cassette domain-containing protein n=1 Tax=Leptolyngbya sp. 7M TaxID=2812896 RepID=UPI0029391B08|nr:ATP-binding cassette domain-containing protein [Leptolyngbya sp. 7M]
MQLSPYTQYYIRKLLRQYLSYIHYPLTGVGVCSFFQTDLNQLLKQLYPKGFEYGIKIQELETLIHLHQASEPQKISPYETLSEIEQKIFWILGLKFLAILPSMPLTVPQESFLFSTTIKNNIRYGDPTSEQPEVEQAAKQAQIHPEILNFPQQYKTIVGERGITLSGGQRQRTALARALLVDAPVLILDDALSSVDNQTATAILHQLSEGTERKTVLFISHQLSAAAAADRILVMDHGRIVQAGTHAELLAQDGLYQSLWETHAMEEAIEEVD